MNPIRIAAVAAPVLAAAALAGVGLPEQARSDEGAPARGITVTASGKVESIPDRAQAGSAKSALGQNADRLADVIDALRKAGVAKDDLQTSQVYLWPQRESDGNTLTGYQAQNTVSVVLAEASANA